MSTTETADNARADARAGLANRAARVAAILFATCLLYVLSVGPVAGAIALLGLDDNETVNGACTVFYWPLIYMVGDNPVDELLFRYTSWWREMAERFR